MRSVSIHLLVKQLQ